MASPRQRLRDYRRAHGLTLRAMAERLGASVSSVVEWETGTRSPGRSAAGRIAELVGIMPSAWDGPDAGIPAVDPPEVAPDPAPSTDPRAPEAA